MDSEKVAGDTAGLE